MNKKEQIAYIGTAVTILLGGAACGKEIKSVDPTPISTPISTPTALASKECLTDTSAPLGAEESKGIVLPKTVEGPSLPWGNGKYQTFPRQVDRDGCLTRQLIDLGTLGPDVDTIFGIDFPGDIQTGALVIYQPSKVLETRVVGIKRADLETVQLRPALGGDRFDVYQMAKYGGDVALDAMARLHAASTARTHQKVVYVGDIGAFENQWGKNENKFLNNIIRAQRPELPGIIMGPDFVIPRPPFK